MRRFALALLLTSTAFGAPADECSGCTALELCAPHAEEERDALERLTTALTLGEKHEKVTPLLDAVQQLAKAHAGAPSPAAARALAAAMKSENSVVATHAAQCLGRGQHPEVAVAALIDRSNRMSELMVRRMLATTCLESLAAVGGPEARAAAFACLERAVDEDRANLPHTVRCALTFDVRATFTNAVRALRHVDRDRRKLAKAGADDPTPRWYLHVLEQLEEAARTAGRPRTPGTQDASTRPLDLARVAEEARRTTPREPRVSPC